VRGLPRSPCVRPSSAGPRPVLGPTQHAGQFCGVCGRFDGADGPDGGPGGPSRESLPPLRGTRTSFKVRGGERSFGRPACRCVGPSAGRTALRRVQGGGPRRACGRAPLERARPPRRCLGRPASVSMRALDTSLSARRPSCVPCQPARTAGVCRGLQLNRGSGRRPAMVRQRVRGPPAASDSAPLPAPSRAVGRAVAPWTGRRAGRGRRPRAATGP
jgi:hypothetical protein